MTAAFLQSELTSLVSDSKRKHAEIRSAADKSLSELKSIAVTSETQLAGDLVRKPNFIDPFLLACKSQHVKLASTGAACLQRLVASTAIPRSRLPDILQAFEEAVTLALDVQLKILQTLPSLLQLYATDLHGEALARTLSVSADLSSNRLPLVSSTAGATFQQLVSAVFARVHTSSKSTKVQSSPETDTVQDQHDALAIFTDLCNLLVHGEAHFVRLENLPPASVLETLETLLVAHGTFILRDANARKACADGLIPGICTLVENSSAYNIVTRALRIGFVLATQYLSPVARSLDVFFNLTIKTADRTSAQPWKRAVCLELYRGICTDFSSLRDLFQRFDLQEKHTNVVSDMMAALVRIASEDPSLIGLGRQSTIPMSSANGGVNSTDSAVDVPVASINQSSPSANIGISIEWSKTTTPCLDVLDRVNPIDVPETYIYTLVLECISALSDGLSKFVMPLSVPQRKPSKLDDSESAPRNDSDAHRRSSLPTAQSDQRLVNPLGHSDRAKSEGVEICAKIIEACWPAVLATCSTFLNAALDSYFYHMLIRTAQRLTQVSGVLELYVPRDALLTTLAKASVPANVSNLMNLYYGSQTALEDRLEEEPGDEEAQIKSPMASTPRQSVDSQGQSLNMRNLLCLRALLNLGIALGPNLSQAAWIIILQALQQVEALMTVGPTVRAVQSQGGVSEAQSTNVAGSLGTEITAVDTARRRMLDSTKGYSDDAFASISKSLLRMIGDILPQQDKPAPPASDNGVLRPQPVTHRSAKSISGQWAKTATLEVEVQFFLKTIGRVSSVNLHRFRTATSSAASWDMIVLSLLDLQGNRRLQPQLRLQCANIIDAIVVEVCTMRPMSEEHKDESASLLAVIVQYGIPALGKQLDNVQFARLGSHRLSESAILTVQNMLQTLQNVVGSCGDKLESGWSAVFRILNMVVAATREKSEDKVHGRLISAAFKVVQLIFSDFLSVLDVASIEALQGLLSRFARSKSDLNIVLTSTALYWDIATLLISRGQHSIAFEPMTRPESSDISMSVLWQQNLLGLAALCREPLPDLRNAALRMLFKVLEASMVYLSSISINSCLDTVVAPLINFYASEATAGEATWKESIKTFLQDLSDILKAHSSLILADVTSFRQMWAHLLVEVREVLKLDDIKLALIAFDTLSETVMAFGQSDDSLSFKGDQDVFHNTWSLWCDNHPERMNSTGSNSDSLASHARLLQALAFCSFDLLASIPDSHVSIFTAARSSVFSARHDQYTRDVKKMSVDQGLALEMLNISQRLSDTHHSWYARQMLQLIDDIVDKTSGAWKELDVPNSRQRIPTGIALATTCIEEVRQLLKGASKESYFWSSAPVNPVLALSAKLTSTKYSGFLPKDHDLLWRGACQLGTDCLVFVKDRWADRTGDLDLSQLSQSINDLVRAILQAPEVESTPSDDGSLKEVILEDEQFDISQLQSLHSSVSSTILPHVSDVHTKIYVLTLFHSSLPAKPGYNDLTTDLAHKPLEDFTTIRRGSIRRPDLPLRRTIYTEALKCLFDLVSTKDRLNSDTTQGPEFVTAGLAAPYVLLRLAHPLKSFIADQRLRYLQHPHIALQKELSVVLGAFTSLRVHDESFVRSAHTLACDISTVNRKDGKIHLRVLYNLMAKFEQAWDQAPRLKKGHAWQEHEYGIGVEQALGEWKRCLSEGWGPRFGESSKKVW